MVNEVRLVRFGLLPKPFANVEAGKYWKVAAEIQTAHPFVDPIKGREDNTAFGSFFALAREARQEQQVSF